MSNTDNKCPKRIWVLVYNNKISRMKKEGEKKRNAIDS